MDSLLNIGIFILQNKKPHALEWGLFGASEMLAFLLGTIG